MASTELLTKFKNALTELESLRISTYVGNATYDAANDKFVPNVADPARVMCTTIKVLTGDITTIIHPDFVSGPYQALRDYHAQKEQQGMAILKANVEVVERLFDFLKKLESEK
jgi:hypothetical protein